MNLEERLQSAAEELNASASRTAPPTLGRGGERVRPWLAFTAAFAVVLAIVGIPYVISRSGPGGPSDAGPLAGADSTTTTECIVPDPTSTTDSGQGEIHIIAFLEDEGSTGVPFGAHDELVEEVEGWDEVASVTYVDKEESWAEYQEVFAGDEELLDIDPSILPASIRIELTDEEFHTAVQALLEERAPVVRSVAVAPTDEIAAAIWMGESLPAVEGQNPAPGDCVEEATTTVQPGPDADVVCVEEGLYPPTTVAYSDDDSDPRDLTEPVKDKLTRIAEAASRCDPAALAALASPDITTSFGPESGPEDIESWSTDDSRFGIITALLNMTQGVTEMSDGTRLYVWPAAFAYDTWDDIPPEAMDELHRIYTQEELDQISLLGSYGGWRIGITESGEWIFFVAGD